MVPLLRFFLGGDTSTWQHSIADSIMARSAFQVFQRRCSGPVTWLLVIILGANLGGCATAARVIPTSTSVTVIHPLRYYDLWKMLRRGRGVLLGTHAGVQYSGKFLSGGSRSISIRTDRGYENVRVDRVEYIVNVLDMTASREGLIAGGIIGLGTGFTVAYMSGGVSSSASSKLARGAAIDPDDSASESATGDSESSSESSAETTPTASSEEGASSTSGSADDGAAASSESSSGDATTGGSNVLGSEETAGSSGESSTGGSDGSETTQSSESSGNSSVIISVDNGQSSGSSSGGTSEPDLGTPSQNQTTSSGAWRTFWYSLAFAAAGSLIGWTIGKRIKKRVPRVDYVLFERNLRAREGRTDRQYLADRMAVTHPKVGPASLLKPGSNFSMPRDAVLFDRFVSTGEVVSLSPRIGTTIDFRESEDYRLFPAVEDYEEAFIVRSESEREMTGTEHRYIAVVTRHRRGRRIVALQRLSAGTVVRLSTQVQLIESGILK
jgi:hypothetical protein